MSKFFVPFVLLAMLFTLAMPAFAEPIEVRGLLQVSEDGAYLNTEENVYMLEGIDLSDLDGQDVVVAGEVREDMEKMIIDVIEVFPADSDAPEAPEASEADEEGKS